LKIKKTYIFVYPPRGDRIKLKVMEEHKHIKEVINRLSKIEGHVRGIKKMLEKGKPCDQVLIQFSAVQAAMLNASKILLEDHFDHCVMGKVTDKTLEAELIEFKRALDSYIR
jgi:DNA-binding FrmR family transcriptional regulator